MRRVAEEEDEDGDELNSTTKWNLQEEKSISKCSGEESSVSLVWCLLSFISSLHPLFYNTMSCSSSSEGGEIERNEELRRHKSILSLSLTSLESSSQHHPHSPRIHRREKRNLIKKLFLPPPPLIPLLLVYRTYSYFYSPDEKYHFSSSFYPLNPEARFTREEKRESVGQVARVKEM